MAFFIGEACVACGACMEMCSLGAVLEGDPQYSIDKEKCISCEACTGICPVGALMESGE